ncbi:hypothetical protein NM2001068_2188 [Neisseria meningitidis 2001068]|nr:hypothetical protein NM2001068_2155 [Neisseria meningitidis 2001068]EOC41830.1 hypothetical protein NM2001068_2188 [Neisseria meningitidis 2001068]
MYQTFDALFDFDECAVVGQVGYFAEQAGALRITAGQTAPRIFAQLFHTQGNALFFLVEFQYFGFNFLTDFQDFTRVFHAPPCQIGDVQQTVDAAQVNECTVIGNVFNDAFDDGAFLQVFQQGFAFFTQSGFQNGAAGNNDVVAFFVQFDHFEFDLFAFEVRSVFYRTYVDQRTRQECADAANHNGQAAFDFSVDDAGQDVAVFHGFFQGNPIGCTFGFFAGQFGFAEAVFDGFDGNGNEVADFNFNFALSVFEFSYINQGF